MNTEHFFICCNYKSERLFTEEQINIGFNALSTCLAIMPYMVLLIAIIQPLFLEIDLTYNNIKYIIQLYTNPYTNHKNAGLQHNSVLKIDAVNHFLTSHAK